MKLKTILLTVGMVSALTSSVQASEAGEVLFDAKCASCHTKTRPNDTSSLVAPPLMGVMRHVKMQHNNKKDAVQFIAEYTLNPQANKAVCEPQKIKRFGLMPSQKENVTMAELVTIGGWMYDNFPPANFQGNRQGKKCNKQNACNKQNTCNKKNPKSKYAHKKAKISSQFLIGSGMPHMTKLVKQNWDNAALNLSEAQKEKLLVVRGATMQSIKSITPQVKALENKITTMTMQGESPLKLNPMVEKLPQLKAEATKTHIHCIYNTNNISTPKQVQFLLQP